MESKQRKNQIEPVPLIGQYLIDQHLGLFVVHVNFHRVDRHSGDSLRWLLAASWTRFARDEGISADRENRFDAKDKLPRNPFHVLWLIVDGRDGKDAR